MKTTCSVPCSKLRRRLFHSRPTLLDEARGSRIKVLGPILKDTYATLRNGCKTPTHPIVLAHGLLGFDKLHLAGSLLPGVQYWRGITEALTSNGASVITASVPPSASIEERAAKLSQNIEVKAHGESVNVIAHSMGGLDARYMISRLKPLNVNVLSLTTIASPHRGSAFADFMFDQIGPERLPKIYRALKALQIETGAFSQLTREYMCKEFNPKTPDREGVKYFSYGAIFEPPIWSAFRQSHRVIEKVEGANDGLVSVASSQWGTYKGTLSNVSHLDLINWTNRLKRAIGEMVGKKRDFNAIAFYLDIADMLAREGF